MFVWQAANYDDMPPQIAPKAVHAFTFTKHLSVAQSGNSYALALVEFSAPGSLKFSRNKGNDGPENIDDPLNVTR